MRKQVHVTSTVSTLAMALVCAVGLAAQGPGISTQPKLGTPVEKPEIDPSQEITATGCLAKEGDKYVLKNAAVLIRPWIAPGLRQDVIGTPKAGASKTVFGLINRDGLEAHVGHTIEVTGVIQPQTANLAPTPDTIVPPGGRGAANAPTAGQQGNADSPRPVPRLNNPQLDNKAPKMISATCS